jgi:hypothetical protein
VQKFSLVVSHVEKHKQEQEKPNSILDGIYEDGGVKIDDFYSINARATGLYRCFKLFSKSSAVTLITVLITILVRKVVRPKMMT